MSMYQGHNPAALRSQKEIVNAFFELLKTNSFEHISIKQIMDETALSRQTFYQIFNSKEDIFEYYINKIFKQYTNKHENIILSNPCEIAKFLFPLFAQYYDFFKILIDNHQNCLLQRKCIEYFQNNPHIQYHLKGTHSPSQQAYASVFIMSGIVSVLEKWIKDESRDFLDVHKLTMLICQITGTDIKDNISSL